MEVSYRLNTCNISIAMDFTANTTSIRFLDIGIMQNRIGIIIIHNGINSTQIGQFDFQNRPTFLKSYNGLYHKIKQIFK